MSFIISKSRFLASEEESLPGSTTEIPVGERSVILLKQYDPARVRFSWNGKHWWAFKTLFEEYTTPETGRDRL